jgi:hypothetical protein
MLKIVTLVLVSTVALLTFTLVAAQVSKAGMSCILKSNKLQSSQRLCVYVCSDKSLEGRFTNADSKCSLRIKSDS